VVCFFGSHPEDFLGGISHVMSIGVCWRQRRCTVWWWSTRKAANCWRS